MFVKLEHSEKVASPIFVIPAGNVIVDKYEQASKAPSPMLLTLEGTSMLEILEQ